MCNDEVFQTSDGNRKLKHRDSKEGKQDQMWHEGEG